MVDARERITSSDGNLIGGSTPGLERRMEQDIERKGISGVQAISDGDGSVEEEKATKSENDDTGDDSDVGSASDDEGTSDGSSGTGESDSHSDTSSNVSFPAAPTPKNTHIGPTSSTFSASDENGNSLAVHPDYADVFGPRQGMEAARMNEWSSGTEMLHSDDGDEGGSQLTDLPADSTATSFRGTPVTPSRSQTGNTVSSLSIGTSLSNTSTDNHYTPSSQHSRADLLRTRSESSIPQFKDSIGTIETNSKTDLESGQPPRGQASVRIQLASIADANPSRHATTTFTSGGAYLGSIFSRRSSESGGISMTPEEKQRQRDQKRLEQLGYSQVLGRDYGFWSNFAVGFCNIGAVQGTIFGILTTFKYGGPRYADFISIGLSSAKHKLITRMILTMWPIAGLFLTIITLSMGELASAYPVAGAMSTWTWKTARGGVGGERIWAWVMGGFVMGYHVGIMALLPWQISSFLKGTLELAVPAYHGEKWHVMLFSLAMLVLFGLVGTSKWGRSPKFWVASGLYIFAVWLVICVSLLAKEAGRRSPSAVFQQPFTNETGFTSRPYIYLIGWVLTSIATGADACAHLSEETQNPARVVPLAMLASVVTTYVMGYIPLDNQAIFILLLAIDPAHLPELRQHSLPAAYIIKNSIGKTATTVICSATLFVFAIQAIAQLQASSRFIWAIARDQALPFSKYLYQTDKNRLPTAATWLVLLLSAPICFLLWPFPDISLSVLSVAAGTFCLISYARD
ncbi:hypothetical protein QFC22_001334 [Naganishia vaughanmartiniae]|uniref:Uncharacterized protein n=1 Tax=Naganishia vaughanmartiniae TaxID=1424756 RepID=A0ACC2XHN3_9TREE|nr:hypothetical protein QFC22_001334 [Naganishia vaughanmartiniae]